MERVLGEPFGRLMLAALAVGLAAYALWMFVAAFVDPERKGKKLSWDRRAARVLRDRHWLHADRTDGVQPAGRAAHGYGGLDLQQVIATVLTPHVGRVIVGLAGLIVMTAGALQLRLGVTGRFRKLLQTGRSRLARARDECQRTGRLRNPRHALADGRLVAGAGGGAVRAVGGERMVGGDVAAAWGWARAAGCSPRRRSA